MDANDTLTKVGEAVKIASMPAILSVASAIAVTQVVKALDHVVWRHLARREVWAVAWLLNIPLFALWCWLLAVPFRGENAALGIVSGIAAPIITALLKRVGVDLDRWIGGKDEGE